MGMEYSCIMDTSSSIWIELVQSFLFYLATGWDDDDDDDDDNQVFLFLSDWTAN